MALTADNSYKIHQVAASASNEVQRLRAQVNLFWRKELRCLQQFGLTDGMRILECGSGPGFLVEKLLNAFPGSHVTGVEIDPYLVDKSRETLADIASDRCEIFEGSINSLPFPDGTFDFVLARLVLEHLPDPVAAAREMRRVLKTGGKVVVIDNDFDLHLRSYPEIPELRDLYEAYCRARVSQGGNPRIGRQLPVTLEEAGFGNVDLEIVVAHSRVVGDLSFLKSEGSGIPAQLVKDGFLSGDVVDRLTQNWHDALKRPDHSLVRQLYVAVGEKLAGDGGSHGPGGGGKTSGPVADFDRQRVARPEPALAGQATSGAASLSRDVVETIFSRMWAQLLEVAEVGLDDNFFDLGGDSILLIDVVAQAREQGFELTPVTIFEHPTVRALAKHLTGGADTVAFDALRARAQRQRGAMGLHHKATQSDPA